MPAGGNFRYLAGAPHPRTGGSLKCSPPGCETPMCSNTTHELKKKLDYSALFNFKTALFRSHCTFHASLWFPYSMLRRSTQQSLVGIQNMIYLRAIYNFPVHFTALLVFQVVSTPL